MSGWHWAKDSACEECGALASQIMVYAAPDGRRLCLRCQPRPSARKRSLEKMKVALGCCPFIFRGRRQAKQPDTSGTPALAGGKEAGDAQLLASSISKEEPSAPLASSAPAAAPVSAPVNRHVANL